MHKTRFSSRGDDPSFLDYVRACVHTCIKYL